MDLTNEELQATIEMETYWRDKYPSNAHHKMVLLALAELLRRRAGAKDIPENVLNLVEFIGAELPDSMDDAACRKFKVRAASVIQGFVARAVEKAIAKATAPQEP